MAGGAGMPYVLAENAVFATLEDLGPAERLASLGRIVDGTGMWLSPMFAGKPNDSDHLKYDWFGFGPGAVASASALPLRSNHKTAGWWAHWYGRPHEIVRQTLQRAYQASLGIEDEAVAAYRASKTPMVSTTFLPLRIVWVCGVMNVQGFVLVDPDVPPSGGKPATKGTGVVAVIATPEADHGFVAPANFASPFPPMYEAVEGPQEFVAAGTHAYVVGHSSDPHEETYKQLGNLVVPMPTLGERLVALAAVPPGSTGPIDLVRPQRLPPCKPGQSVTTYEVYAYDSPNNDVITDQLDPAAPAL